MPTTSPPPRTARMRCARSRSRCCSRPCSCCRRTGSSRSTWRCSRRASASCRTCSSSKAPRSSSCARTTTSCRPRTGSRRRSHAPASRKASTRTSRRSPASAPPASCRRAPRSSPSRRPPAARTALATLEKTERGKVWTESRAAAETALGKGMLSQGRLDDAERALTTAIDLAPSDVDALETLATIYYKPGRLTDASHTSAAALVAAGSDLERRARIERIAADVARSDSRPRDAAVLYLTAMHDWSELLKAPQPPKSLLAEGQLEAGRGLWFLGHTDRAVDLVLSATEEDADSAATFASAVSFLIQVDRPVDALDALHRALSADVGELYKVYMCLWVLGDERRRGEARDRQAVEYLGSRHGDLWYEQRAEAATGRLDFATLRANANTAPRQAELAVYGVTLGRDPEAAAPAYVKKKLIEVLEAGLVMDAEYDLARLYLSTP